MMKTNIVVAIAAALTLAACGQTDSGLGSMDQAQRNEEVTFVSDGTDLTFDIQSPGARQAWDGKFIYTPEADLTVGFASGHEAEMGFKLKGAWLYPDGKTPVAWDGTMDSAGHLNFGGQHSQSWMNEYGGQFLMKGSAAVHSVGAPMMAQVDIWVIDPVTGNELRHETKWFAAHWPDAGLTPPAAVTP